MSRSLVATVQAMDVALDDPALVRRASFERDFADLDHFIFKMARTRDEHDTTGIPKPFPADWPYLHDVLAVYQASRLLAVEKARQLMITWLFAAVVVWELRHPGRRWGWVSLKEDHADAALERCWDVITALPGTDLGKNSSGRRSYRDAGGVLWERSDTLIRLPELHSIANAMSQTADDARSFTYSGIVFDEFAFMPQGKAGYAAAKPTIDNGRAVLITTPGAINFAYELFQGHDYAEEAA